jgi:hypothetical protein
VASLAFPGYKLCKAAMRNEPGSILPEMLMAAVNAV